MLTIGFSHEVDASLLAAGVSLADAAGNALPAGGPSVQLISCVKSWDPKCVSARINGQLEVDTAYTIKIASGTRYHPLCGPTASETSFNIAGLLSFQIPFSQGLTIPDSTYRQTRPQYRRWNLWVRHGLAASTTVRALHQAITIDPAVDFTLTQLNRATFQMEGAFDPATTYSITVAGSPHVVDGFNLPLVAGGSQFETRDAPHFFVEAGSYSASDAIFSADAGFPEQWTALALGADECMMSYNEQTTGCVS